MAISSFSHLAIKRILYNPAIPIDTVKKHDFGPSDINNPIINHTKLKEIPLPRQF